jgi:hypothetical protein
VNLGYEPQWVLQKIVSGGATSGVDDWKILDTMRGFTNPSSDDVQLKPNSSSAEQNTSWGVPTATGFTFSSFASATYIYIAIRRGPMAVPTVGTSVFGPLAYTANNTTTPLSSFGPIDMYFATYRNRAATGYGWWLSDRVRGNKALMPAGDAQYGFQGTSAEITETTVEFANSVGLTPSGNNQYYAINASPITGIGTPTYTAPVFRRAPGFFDVVCYTGDGVGTLTVYHNLAAYPELVIIKRRNSSGNWMVNTLTNGSVVDSLGLNSTSANNASLYQGVTYAEPTYMGVRQGGTLANISGATYVAYLFATCAGVSKVGSYTGTGAAQTINCGFTAGSRFVMIKRTDSTGDWNVWDSARGIIPANDPYLALNTTAAEVTGTDYVDTTNVGFDITSTAPAAINASGGTYIFLAIA